MSGKTWIIDQSFSVAEGTVVWHEKKCTPRHIEKVTTEWLYANYGTTYIFLPPVNLCTIKDNTLR